MASGSGDPSTHGPIDREQVRSILSDAARSSEEPSLTPKTTLPTPSAPSEASATDGRDAEERATEIIAEAEAEATAIVLAAEIAAERRSERVLSEAQERLNTVLAEERRSHDRLRRALNEVEAQLGTLERIAQITPTPSPDPAASTPIGEAVDEGPSIEVREPVKTIIDTAPQHRLQDEAFGGLVKSVKNAIRAKISA